MSDAEHIEARAAGWLMRRDAGEAGESPDFTAWLAADPRHRAAYLRLAAAWESTRQLKRLRPEGGPIDPDLLAPKRSGVGHWKPLALAAGVVLVVLSATWWTLRAHDAQVYRTDVGGLSRVLLADGSTVVLNTDTELKVRLLPEKREIALIRGEAQFTVAHDAKRPFEVAAGGRIVRAVGTAFDVRLDAGQDLEVMVTEGRVTLEASGLDLAVPGRAAAPVATVAAGESAVAKAGVVTVRRVAQHDASRRLAWESGELSFEGETLKEAVAEFNRYNRKKLRLDDASIENLNIGGNFRALDVESFVAALDRSFGITSKVADDGTLMLTGAAVRSE